METIEVRFATKPCVAASWARRFVAATLKSERRAGWGVSVLITGDAEIRRLNRGWLRHDYATDVIAFGVEGPTLPGTERLLGDVVVSADTARRVAAELGLPWREELARYLVHGTLHLIGYDDKKPADHRRMHRRQEAILKKAWKGTRA
ncbi:MAG TPA: rRNA maturation RNase YbeY [Candidatus Eisenbacteria bacterium]|nr:rRNA maturation RNase YbeY [Candidatus Eisenbacteria bacterium]